MRFNETVHLVASINLALTVFWDNDDMGVGAVEDPWSHVSCLWPIDQTSRSRETEKDSSAGNVGITVWALVGAAFVTVWGMI